MEVIEPVWRFAQQYSIALGFFACGVVIRLCILVLTGDAEPIDEEIKQFSAGDSYDPWEGANELSEDDFDALLWEIYARQRKEAPLVVPSDAILRRMFSSPDWSIRWRALLFFGSRLQLSELCDYYVMAIEVSPKSMPEVVDSGLSAMVRSKCDINDSRVRTILLRWFLDGSEISDVDYVIYFWLHFTDGKLSEFDFLRHVALPKPSIKEVRRLQNEMRGRMSTL